MNASELIERAVRTLSSSKAIDHWQKDRELIEAEELLSYAMGGEVPDSDEDISYRARRRFEAMIERRATGEPVAYIKGYVEFRSLQLKARRGVFVPRDSTEFLAEQAVRRLRGRRGSIAVDVATGGGPVALAVAAEVPDTCVYATDLSFDAIALARANARRLGLRAAFVVGDLFSPLPRSIARRVDVITLHPPYVARREMRDLPDEVKRFEPVHTLTDRSTDGLGLVERTVSEAHGWLRRGGWLLIEVSPDRARAVSSLLRGNGFRDVRSTKAREFPVTRVVLGRW